MKQKHFISLILAIAFIALFSNTSEAHRCHHRAYRNYGYQYMPPPPPPVYYYNYPPPRYCHPHHPPHFNRGYGRRW